MASDSTTQRVATFPQLLAHALKYGGIAGLVGGAWMIADYALGFQTERADIGKWTSIGAMVIPIAAVILGMMHWRNDALGGRIRFVQAFGLALAIGLVFSTCMALAAWLHASTILPELLIRKTEQHAAVAGQQSETTREELARTIETSKANSVKISWFVFSHSLRQSLFVGLIAAITVPKQRPGSS